jgi:hypothetical protein
MVASVFAVVVARREACSFSAWRQCVFVGTIKSGGKQNEKNTRLCIFSLIDQTILLFWIDGSLEMRAAMLEKTGR